MNYIHESVFVILYEVVGMFSFKLNGKTVMVDGLSTMFWHNLLRISSTVNDCHNALPRPYSCVRWLQVVSSFYCIKYCNGTVYWLVGRLYMVVKVCVWALGIIIYEFLECQSDNNSSYYNVRLDTMCQTSEDFNSRHISIVFIGAKVSYPCWCCL